MITARVFGFGAVARGMAKTAIQVQAGAAQTVRETVAYGETAVRANASGRPGPRVIFGVYRRSIVGEVILVEGARAVGQIGTNDIRARRLEYGFVGPDSIGRVYNQPPYPHFAPAEDAIARFMESRARATIGQRFGGAA